MENRNFYYDNSATKTEKENNKIKKEHRGGWFVTIVAVCLVCSLLGGVAGVAFWNLIDTNGAAVVSDTTAAMSGGTVSGSPIAATDTSEPEPAVMSAAEIYAANLESIVKVETTIVSKNVYGLENSSVATGTGFVISPDGYIFTNNHVIADGASFKVIFKNGDSYDAEVVGTESNGNDIALLKIDATDLRPVELGDSDTLSIGDGVYVIGHPLGELDYSLTVGVISALDREIAIDNDILWMFQIDAAVNPGNSGGPVFNRFGQVVGMVTAKYSDEDVEGLGFAIGINGLTSSLDDLKEFGYVRGRPYFGIGVKNAAERTDAEGNVISPAGAVVSTVDKGSCAETAGICVGDIITALGDKTVGNVSDLLQAKQSYRAHDSVEVTVFRNGEYLTLLITFDEYAPSGATQTEEPEQTVPSLPGQGGNW